MFEGIISADEVDQPAIFLIKILNEYSIISGKISLFGVLEFWSRTLYQKREINVLFILDFL